jgi:hypothetical protein
MIFELLAFLVFSHKCSIARNVIVRSSANPIVIRMPRHAVTH